MLAEMLVLLCFFFFNYMYSSTTLCLLFSLIKATLISWTGIMTCQMWLISSFWGKVTMRLFEETGNQVSLCTLLDIIFVVFIIWKSKSTQNTFVILSTLQTNQLLLFFTVRISFLYRSVEAPIKEVLFAHLSVSILCIPTQTAQL